VLNKIAIFLNVFLVFLTISSLAQSPGTPASPALSPEVARRIQTEVRAHYNVPSQVEIAISEPKSGEINGYDQITITFSGGGQSSSHDFLISRDRLTLARLEKFDISKDFMSKINVNGRPVRGNAGAKVTIVNFDDFQCPFCSRMHATLFPGLLKKYGSKVKIIYKDYPLVEIHPWAMHAAVAANCLAEQNNDAYWDFADYIHEKQKEVGRDAAGAAASIDRIAADLGGKRKVDAQKLNACIAKGDETAIRASMAEADKLGVDSTPTMFINGERTSGAISEAVMSEIINRALVLAGEEPVPVEKPAPSPPGANR
jgi:protein-disulfide isomerase